MATRKRALTGNAAPHKDSVAAEGQTIRFLATLHRPALGPGNLKSDDWSFLKLPSAASSALPSRGMVSVEGTMNGVAFQATLAPDGAGGHWLRVDRTLRTACGGVNGTRVQLAIRPLPPDREPEPTLPDDFHAALGAAPAQVRHAWRDITPAARRDFIHWVTSPKRPETRVKRIATACDMLLKGKRRPCCFDRSGMYDGSQSCPVAADASEP